MNYYHHKKKILQWFIYEKKFYSDIIIITKPVSAKIPLTILSTYLNLPYYNFTFQK